MFPRGVVPAETFEGRAVLRQLRRRIDHGRLGLGVSIEVLDVGHVGPCPSQPCGEGVADLVGGEHGPPGPARGGGERPVDAAARPRPEGFGVEEGAGGGDTFRHERHGGDPQARLLTQIQGAVAEYERIKIAERYRRGKLFRARQGEVCWGKVSYGYRRIPRRDGVPAHVEVSEPEAQVVRQIFRWHVDEHLSVRQIALRLTESPHLTATGLPRWGISTVTRMLHNEAYIGTMYYNRRESVGGKSNSASRRRRLSTCRQDRPAAEWIPLPVPPIIDVELFRRSQAIHYDNSRFSPRHLKSGHYLLRRVVRCRVCDLTMSCHRMRGRNGAFHHYYYCHGHDQLMARRAISCCPQMNLRSDELDALVWGEVRRHLENPTLIREGYARLQTQAGSPGDDGLADELAALEKQLAELDREEHRLLDAYQAGLVDIDQLRQRQGRLRQRRAHVNGSIEVLHTERKTAQQQAQLQADLETFVDRIRGTLATTGVPQWRSSTGCWNGCAGCPACRRPGWAASCPPTRRP